MVYHRSEATGSRTDRNRGAPPARTQPAVRNAFRNDGSFLEMFKKLQEGGAPGRASASDAPRARPESDPSSSSSSKSKSDLPAPSPGPASESGLGLGLASAPEPPSANALNAPKKAQPIVGKRRGGRVLPTGVVKKKRTDEEDEEDKPKDAWSLYMAEVRRYKETSCEEDGKTRPLVK